MPPLVAIRIRSGLDRLFVREVGYRMRERCSWATAILPPLGRHVDLGLALLCQLHSPEL